MALTQTSQVKYDKTGFRALILPLTRSLTGGAQVQAFYALYNTERKDSDLDLLLKATKDPSKEMKESLSHLIHLFSKGNVTGEAATPVLRLLLEDDRRTVREALRGLWGAKVSPAIEAQVIELAKNPRTRHDAIYFGLSTFQDKSKAVIEVLVDALGDPDGNNSGRALWGLGHGVPLENYRQVADAFRGLLESRTDRSTRSEALRGLSRYGDASDLEALDAIAANEMASDHEKKAAKDAAARIRARVGK
jgi:hypothetical protein